MPPVSHACRICGRPIRYRGRGRPRTRCVTCQPATPPPRRRPPALVPPGCPLTPGQLEAVRLLAEGLLYEQIADRLGIGVSTVRTHLFNVYRRLGVYDRAQAVLLCAREGWISTPLARRTRSDTLLEQCRTILASCLEQLEQGTRHRVTSDQFAYLQALDRFIRQPGQDEDRTLGRALARVLKDAQVVPSGVQRRNAPRPVADPTATLAA